VITVKYEINIMYEDLIDKELILCILLYIFTSSDPETHPYISKEEKTFLTKNRTQKNNKAKSIPWKSILTSKAFHGVWITHYCQGWLSYLLVEYLPIFSIEVLDLNDQEAGLTAAIPYVGMLLFKIILGKLFDVIKARNYISLTNQRKVFNSIGRYK